MASGLYCSPAATTPPTTDQSETVSTTTTNDNEGLREVFRAAERPMREQDRTAGRGSEVQTGSAAALPRVPIVKVTASHTVPGGSGTDGRQTGAGAGSPASQLFNRECRANPSVMTRQ